MYLSQYIRKERSSFPFPSQLSPLFRASFALFESIFGGIYGCVLQSFVSAERLPPLTIRLWRNTARLQILNAFCKPLELALALTSSEIGDKMRDDRSSYVISGLRRDTYGEERRQMTTGKQCN